MPDALLIRSANESDLVSLQGLYQHLNPDDPPVALDRAAAILDHFERYAGSAILLGICDDIAVTTCALVVVPNLTRGGAPYGLIENVVTDPRYRRRGFGKAILTEAVSLAWQHDCYKVMLLSGRNDSSTLKFYGDAGFEKSKTGLQIRRAAAGTT